MKAIVFTEYGSPEVLKFKDIAKPTPKDNEVLIKVRAASANPADWHIMRGAPFIARFTFGLLKPQINRLGADIAGRVAAIGKDVTEFRVGDEVFGSMPLEAMGSFAEYVCTTEESLVLKPAKLTFEQAAAVPMAALTALQGLRDKGKIGPGQKVLINGASGGVGTFAVQIAKSYGTEVTGVCSTRNLEMVRSIGADHVIDYTKEDFTHSGRRYDLMFDAVGNLSVADSQRMLSPNGICAVAGFTNLSRLFEVILLGTWISKTGGQEIGLMETAKTTKEDLIALKHLLESGKVVAVIDRTYSLPETPEAIRYLETGRARGKVIIAVEPSN